MTSEPQIYDLVYNCGPVAKKYHADQESRVKLLIGPFGTGKTSSAAFDIVELQSERVLPTRGKKRSRFAVVRNTYPELRDTTIKTYLDWFPPGVFGRYNISEKIFRITYEDKEIEIIFKALDTPKDVRDLLSLELTGAHVDEAREVHHDVIKGLLGRVGRFPSLKDTAGKNPFLTPPQISLTSNYPSNRHFLYQEFVSEPVDGYTIYEQGQEENKHNLRPGYYEDLEKDYKTRPDLLRTLVRGEWGITVKGKQVYPEFNSKYHVSNTPLLPLVCEGIKSGEKIIAGWDNTGLSPACVLTYINSIGQWFIFKEFCAEDMGIVDFAEMVQMWIGQYLPVNMQVRHIGDPAGKNRDTTKQSAADYMRKHCNITVEDGIQTFKVRRESVAGRLNKSIQGEPSVLIDPGCVVIIDGFEGGYAYPEIGNSGVFGTEPIKNEYSHIHDAVQYPATVLFKSTVKPKKKPNMKGVYLR